MKQKDLQNMYQQFRHYFCKNMPKTMGIRITRSNSYLAAAWHERETGNMGIYFGKPLMIEMLGKENVSWESILLHEMCHIWQIINLPNDKEAHSDRFMDKLRAVERLTGIKQYWNFEI